MSEIVESQEYLKKKLKQKYAERRKLNEEIKQIRKELEQHKHDKQYKFKIDTES